MAAVEMGVDLSTLVDILVTGNREQIIAAAHEHLQHGESADVLIGRIGMIAAHGDTDGHSITTLDAAAMLCRLLHTIPSSPNADVQARALPLFTQALLIAAPAIQAGRRSYAQPQYPSPLFPSGLTKGQSVSDTMRSAIENHDPLKAERLLLGLYGTGADYRSMQVRAYDSIATTFQNAGHPLIFAVRGFQLLDTVEWGDRVPNIIHWLAPHLPLHPDASEPEWINTVRNFTADPAHSVASIRKRLAPPKDENTLPLRQLILSNADTSQICQGVYDALMGSGASPRAVGSVIALASADLLQTIGDSDRELFVRISHGLLFSAATRLVFHQVQDVEVLTLLFTSAAFINALQKEVATQQGISKEKPSISKPSSKAVGGGLFAPSLLDTLSQQLKGKNQAEALTTAQHYLKLGYDARALFATIGLAAAEIAATTDQGHTLQIVQAASEEFLAWPASLNETSIDGFLQVALRATIFG